VREGLPGDSMLWTLHADEYPNSPASHAPIRAYAAFGARLL